MHLTLLIDCLRASNRRLALGHRLIAKQRRLIHSLRKRRADTTEAENLLQTLHESSVAMNAHKNGLLEEIRIVRQYPFLEKLDRGPWSERVPEYWHASMYRHQPDASGT